MARSAITQHGETLDQLLWRTLGTTAPVDAVFAANPALAEYGPILPAGIEIELPATAVPAAQLRETVTLWN